MLKPSEKAALVKWWHYTGRHIVGGFSTGLAIVGIPAALLIGFTVN